MGTVPRAWYPCGVETKDSGRRTGPARRFVYGSLHAFMVALLVLAGCASGSGQRRSATATASGCASDTDCRLVSDYCDGCACRALAAGEADPTCKGTLVQCFMDPCQGQRAVCQAGVCVTAR
jgi:hypothetical protein